MQPMTDLDPAELAMHLYAAARIAHSEAIEQLTGLQRERPRQKLAALVRICATTHPATGKNYSASQADDLLQLDPEYAEYKARVSEAEAEVREAAGDEYAAYLGAVLRVQQTGPASRPILVPQGVR